MAGLTSVRLPSMSKGFFALFIKMLPVHIGILAIILNDWQVFGTSISDPLAIVGIALLSGGLLKVTSKQVALLLGILLIVIGNLILSSILHSDFSLTASVFYIIKVCIYALFIVLLYNYTICKKLINATLASIISWAVIASLIGIYITIVIVSGLNLPYDFLWTFTRQDVTSYIYMGESGIVRTRSIFSEPQHLGLFLNLVLILVLFGKHSLKPRKLSMAIITTTALLTLSFSTIPVTLFIIALAFLRKYNLRWIARPEPYIFVGLLLIGTLVFQESLNTTIFSRLDQITSGEDASATLRTTESWSYIEFNNILVGNGMGTTPNLQNNYAYILTDFGIFVFAAVIYLTVVIFRRNPYMGLFFILFSFQKGGYITLFYWLLVMYLFMYSTGSHLVKVDKNVK